MGMIVWHMVPGDGVVPPGLPGALDLSTCVSNGDITIVRTNPNPPSAVAYNYDGTEAWCNGTASNNAVGFDLAVDYILPGGTPANNGNNIASSTANDSSWKWSIDGLFLYGGTAPKVYTLTFPFILSSAAVTSVNVSMNSTRGSTITSDGLRVYLGTSSPSERITLWNLSTPWDLTTAVQDSLNFAPMGFASSGIAISNDETRMYVVSSSGDVREYIMGTPGDLTTIPVSGTATPNYTLSVVLTDFTTTTAIYVAYDMAHMLIGGSGSSPRCGFYSLTGSPA